MSRTTKELLDDALIHLDTVQAYAIGDLDDQMIIDAICMRLSAAIETLARLDDGTRQQLFGDDWPLMWARETTYPMAT